MTPNELADYLHDFMFNEVVYDEVKHNQSQLMLRQQQADLKDADKYVLELERLYEDAKTEIEALKANRKHDFGLGEASGFIKGHKENPYKAITNTKIEPTVVSYTHPVKELTDEEIKAVYGEYFDVENFDWLHLQCIQAILKKAQEK